MKKFKLFPGVVLLALVLCSCMYAEAAEEIPDETADTAAAAEISPQFDEEEAAEKIRQHYEELGYTELHTPTTFDELCTELGIDESLRELACRDVHAAAPDEQSEILAARQEIIHMATSEYGWYDDESDIYVTKFSSEEKEWRKSLKFSEIFPGWDKPTSDA